MVPDPRHFDDAEVRRILEWAVALPEEDPPAPSALPVRSGASGLTLEEIQGAAAEVGIDPARVARAAALVEAEGAVRDDWRFGVPLGLNHTVALARALDDAEWDRLVVRMRESFGLDGEVTREGSLRTWRAGALSVLLEPDPGGHGARLRLASRDLEAKGMVEGGVATGTGGVGLLAVLAAFALAGVAIEPALVGLGGVLSVLGGGLYTVGRARARTWRARIRSAFVETGDTARQVAAADPGRSLPPHP